MCASTIEHDKLRLSRLQLFRNVNLDSLGLNELLAQCDYRELNTADVLLSTGEANDCLYILISGRLAGLPLILDDG